MKHRLFNTERGVYVLTPPLGKQMNQIEAYRKLKMENMSYDEMLAEA